MILINILMISLTFSHRCFLKVVRPATAVFFQKNYILRKLTQLLNQTTSDKKLYIFEKENFYTFF